MVLSRTEENSGIASLMASSRAVWVPAAGVFIKRYTQRYSVVLNHKMNILLRNCYKTKYRCKLSKELDHYSKETALKTAKIHKS